MNIEHLREFTYLAETLSFTLTARHFFMSASVLSKHVASMEDDLQVKLFERSRRNVELTEEGERFYRDIVPIIDAYDRAVADIAPSRRGGRLLVRVGYLRGAARPFLPKFLDCIEKSRSDVDLELTCMEYGELIRAHRSQRVDVILNMDFDPEAVEACDFEPIYRDRLYVVVGKRHRLASCSEGILVGALSGEALMLPDEQSYPGLAYRYGEIVRNASDVKVVGRYHDIDTLYLRVARGDCVGFSSGHNFHLFEGRAAFVPLRDIDTTYTVSAQWLRRADPAIGEVAREAARASAAYMKGWSDGIASA